MPKRGRKLPASLSVVATSLPQRMAPPECLTDAQARVWRSIIAARPADYFDTAAGHLLGAFCGAVCSADLVSGMIDAFDPAEIADARGLRRYDRLLAMRDRQTRMMMSLARSLRLTVQSTKRADAASLRPMPAGSRRPWEIGSGDDEPA